jgi:nucleoside-diphosphate-sugar epimerase
MMALLAWLAGWAATVLAAVCVLKQLFQLLSPRRTPMQGWSDADTFVAAGAKPRAAVLPRGVGAGEGGAKGCAGKLRVCVTGGCGFLGTAIVRQLHEKHDYAVTVLDLRVPAAGSVRRVAGVAYVAADLTTDELTPHFEQADVVCHAAGVVCLMDDPGLLHNIHVVATRNVIRCCRLAGVRSLCFTSSGGAVTSPYISASQLDIPPDLVLPTDYQFCSHYSRTKYAAERLALRANDNAAGGMAVVALRLPGLYGVGDRLIVDPLLAGTMAAAPSKGPGVLIDFCYVENAAHAHCVAVVALHSRPVSVAGRAFNITDGDSRPPLDMWNGLLALCRPGTKPIAVLPFALAYALACGTEWIDWLTAGRVPFPSHCLWSLTRASLGYATTAVTLQLSPELGYKPLLSVEEAFDDIKTISGGNGNGGIVLVEADGKKD